MLRWFLSSLNPFPPRGMRHTALPTTGILARNRAIAMKVAHTRALIERDSISACSSEAEWAGMSERGGQAAFELLAGLPTLEGLNAMRAEDIAASTCAHCSHLRLAPDIEAAGSPKRVPRRPRSAPASPALRGWRLGDSI